MAYWRMQLHPGGSTEAVKHAVESLSAGFIGLDFGFRVPDMLTVTPEALPEVHRNYYAFASEMEFDDRVLLFTHHFPLALVRVAGEYNYIRDIAPEIGVWFRHFRKIDDVRYYGDYVTDARKWEYITMTGTIAPLRDPKSKTYQLIEKWLGATRS
jgi:hypothetical protein